MSIFGKVYPEAPTINMDRLAQLTLAAERFLRCGGLVTLGQWAELSVEDEAALGAAYERVEADRLFKLATALRSEEGAAEVAAVVDGGALRTRLWLMRGVSGGE